MLRLTSAARLQMQHDYEIQVWRVCFFTGRIQYIQCTAYESVKVKLATCFTTTESGCESMSSAVQPVRNLHPRYYTDPVIYQREQSGILSQTWQYAGHESQLPNSGDFFTFEIAGQNLFCVRDDDAVIRAFYNVCQHRAHELVIGAGNKRVIVCPYHAWTYNLNGQLRNARNLSAVEGVDCSSISLTPVRLENFHGFLFVNLDSDTAPMDEWYPNVREELLEFVPHIDQLAVLQVEHVVEQCNWKLSVENYSECYHCAINHKTFSNGVVKPDTYDIQPQGYCLRHTTECQNFDQMSYAVDLDANSTAGKYSSWYLWPMFSFQVYPGNILNTYCWRALDTTRVQVQRGWYFVEGEEVSVIHQLAEQDLQTTVAEDIKLVESVQRGMGSRGYQPGPLVIDPRGGVNSEHSIKVLQEWMCSDTQQQ